MRAELKRKPGGSGRSGTQTLPVEEVLEPLSASQPLEIRAATRGELEQVVTVRGRAFKISRAQWYLTKPFEPEELRRVVRHLLPVD